MINRLLVAGLLATAAVAAQAQTVFYEGRQLDFSREDRPYSSRGTVMVPARKSAEMIGASFDRDNTGRRISMRWRNNRVDYWQGDNSFDLNGRRVSMRAGSEVRYDTLFVPMEIFRDLTDGRFNNNRSTWNPGDIGRRRPNDPDDPWNRRDDRYNPGWDSRYGRGSVMFENRALTFDYDEQPYERGGVLMVPFRAMGEKIGARTDRTEDGLRVWIYYGGDRVEYNKGHSWYRLNSTRRELRTTSEDRRNVLFVPITLFEDVTRGRVRGY